MKQNFYSFCGGDLDASSTTYNPFFSSNNSGWNTSSNYRSICTTGGIFRNLYVNLDTAPGSGKSYTFTIVKNGSDTSLVVVISDTNISGSDTGHDVTVVAGDLLSIKCVPSGTPTVAKARWGSEFEGGTSTETLVGSYTDSMSTIASRIAVQGGRSHTTDANAVTQTVPVAGTFKNLYVSLDTAPGLGKSRVFTLYKNGSSTGLAVTISGTNTSGSDTSNTVSVSAGDYIYIYGAVAGSVNGTNASIGMTFLTDIDGDAANFGTSFNNTGGAYFPPGGVDVMFTEYEARGIASHDAAIKNLYVNLQTAPGSGKSRTLTLYKNGSSTGLAVTISGTNTSGSDTSNTVSLTSGDEIDLRDTESNNPANTYIWFGFVSSISVGTAYTSTLTESLSLTESFVKSLDRSIFETVTLTDTYARVLTAYRTFSEPASMEDVLNKNTTRLFSEVMSASEVFEALRVIIRELTESINMGDDFSRTASFVREFVDTAGMVEAFGEAADYARTLSDTASLADTKQTSLFRVLNDVLTGQDTRIYSLARSLPLETLSMTESFTASVVKVLDLTDSLTMHDILFKCRQKPPVYRLWGTNADREDRTPNMTKTTRNKTRADQLYSSTYYQGVRSMTQ